MSMGGARQPDKRSCTHVCFRSDFHLSTCVNSNHRRSRRRRAPGGAVGCRRPGDGRRLRDGRLPSRPAAGPMASSCATLLSTVRQLVVPDVLAVLSQGSRGARAVLAFASSNGRLPVQHVCGSLLLGGHPSLRAARRARHCSLHALHLSSPRCPSRLRSAALAYSSRRSHNRPAWVRRHRCAARRRRAGHRRHQRLAAPRPACARVDRPPGEGAAPIAENQGGTCCGALSVFCSGYTAQVATLPTVRGHVSFAPQSELETVFAVMGLAAFLGYPRHAGEHEDSDWKLEQERRGYL